MNAHQVLVPKFLSDRAEVLAGARLEVDYASGETHTRAETPAPGGVMVQIQGRRVATSDVRDLIDAAGPLTLRDIAGGLDVPLREASTLVDWMLDHDRLKQDEWGRRRLAAGMQA